MSISFFISHIRTESGRIPVPHTSTELVEQSAEVKEAAPGSNLSYIFFVELPVNVYIRVLLFTWIL
jgi:hypothetical protein